MDISRLKKLDYKKALLALLFWGVLTLLLVILIGGFKPLFTGNQNSKMLHGLAETGYGYLDQDWLANSKDPLLVFTWIVKFTHSYLDLRLFFVYQFILVGIYLYSLIKIADHFYHIRRSNLLFAIFLLVYLLTYSDMWPFALRDLFHNGVAGQNTGLPYFLPNIFAAFLFLSVLLFLKGKPYWAVVAIVVAANLHTNYLIAGAALVSSYLVIDFWERRDFKRVVMIGGFALLLVLPIVLSYLNANQDATAAQLSESDRILVNIRIPHHALVQQWWDGAAFLRTLLVLAALYVTRRTKLFPILLISLLIIAAPTVLLFIRPSNKLAALQLWRVSVILMPLASTALIGAMVNSIYETENELICRWRWLVIVVLGGLMAAGLVSGVQKILENYFYDIEEYPNQALMSFVDEHGGPDQMYLVPPTDTDLDSFRLETGQPIYINWKTNPWYATDMLEWYRRNKILEKFYNTPDEERCALLPGVLAETGATHIVMPDPDPLLCDNVETIYTNEAYKLYRVLP